MPAREQSNKRPEKWVVVSCLLAMLGMGMENGNAQENEGNAATRR